MTPIPVPPVAAETSPRTESDCFAVPDPGGRTPAAPELPEVEAVCCLSPVCDFLLWALYRQDRFGLCPPAPPGAPVTERYGHFPQFAAARGAAEPRAALALLPEYARE